VAERRRRTVDETEAAAPHAPRGSFAVIVVLVVDDASGFVAASLEPRHPAGSADTTTAVKSIATRFLFARRGTRQVSHS